MNTYVPYEDLLRDHPEQVEKVTRKIQKGKGKLRDTPPNTWEWYYCWSVTIQAFDIHKFLRGESQEAFDPFINASVCADCGRASAGSGIDMVPILLGNEYANMRHR